MKKIAAIIIILCAVFALPPKVYANSAEPPALAVIVYDAPYDLEIQLGLENGETARTEMRRNNRDYKFEFFNNENGDYEKLIVSYGGENFEIACSWENYGYDAVITLNLKDRTITEGVPRSKTVTLVVLRVLLTLIIEGAVFFMFGYRQRRSWIAFVIINLITQGGLNIIFLSKNIGYLWFHVFVLTEFFVFAVEISAFVIILREKKPIIAAVYAFIANFMSLYFGAVLIDFITFNLFLN